MNKGVSIYPKLTELKVLFYNINYVDKWQDCSFLKHLFASMQLYWTTNYLHSQAFLLVD